MARKRREARAAEVAADYSPSTPTLAKYHAVLRSQARAVLAHALLKPKAACAPKAGAPKSGAPKAGAPKADSPITPTLAKYHADLRSKAPAELARALLKPKAACAPKAGAPKAGAPKAGGLKADALKASGRLQQPAVQFCEQVQVVDDSVASKLKL